SASVSGLRNRRLPYLARNSSPHAESAAPVEQGKSAASAEPLTAAPTAAAVASTSRAACLLTTKRAASLSKPKCETGSELMVDVQEPAASGNTSFKAASSSRAVSRRRRALPVLELSQEAVGSQSPVGQG